MSEFPHTFNKNFIQIGGTKGLSWEYLPRCLACNSERVEFKTALVDEKDTFAIRPQDVTTDTVRKQRNYRYQEYLFMSCYDCWFTWNSSPTGRWSTYPDRMTSEPYVLQATRLIDENTRMPIREQQDYLRSALQRIDRFSEAPLAENIIQSQITVLTGAGASAPFGYPTAKDTVLTELVQNDLSNLLIGDMLKFGTVDNFLQQRMKQGAERFALLERAKNDVEILVDILLKLQAVAVREGDDAGFEKFLYEYGLTIPSWFVFDESLRGEYVYPPLTLTSHNKDLRSAFKTCNYFRTIRKALQTTCTSLLTSCGIPDSVCITKALSVLKPFIDQVRHFNNGPLPVFTTNYDELIEATFIASGEDVVDGFERKSGGEISIKVKGIDERVKIPIYYFNPTEWTKCSNNDIALFHIHGSSQYIIEPVSGKIYYADCVSNQLPLLHKLAWESDYNCIIGSIVPATCKERYVYSPPFSIMYDYLNESLKISKVCIIVGMSGRDHMIKSILHRRSKSNMELRFLIITLGDPPPHLKDILPKERSYYWQNGFSSSAVEWISNHLKQLF